MLIFAIPFGGSQMGIHWLKWPLVTYTRGGRFLCNFPQERPV
jgi:hypothetical protein